MPPLPQLWKSLALEAAGIQVTQAALTVMGAWSTSTPVPTYVNNPIGMPQGSSGAPGLLNTGYAMFATPGDFYAAFAKFAASSHGKALVKALGDDNPYAAAWRVISALKWPGSRTETDYPAVLLDMTADSYRASVGASDASARKTSGVVGAPAPNKSAVIENARQLANAGNAVIGATDMVRYLLQNGQANG